MNLFCISRIKVFMDRCNIHRSNSNGTSLYFNRHILSWRTWLKYEIANRCHSRHRNFCPEELAALVSRIDNPLVASSFTFKCLLSPKSYTSRLILNYIVSQYFFFAKFENIFSFQLMIDEIFFNKLFLKDIYL